MLNNLLLISILTGIISGFFISIYGLLTKVLSYLLYWGDPMQTIPKLPVWYLYTIPVVSILTVNYLISKNSAIKEYGVKEIADAIEENDLEFSIKDLLLKIFASSLSLASGFAVGNEGPSAAIGAMIAHKLHKFFKLPSKLMRISLSIGASSGIASIFVSPVTGIMFAIENIAYGFVKNYAGYLITSSVLAFSIASYFLESLIFVYSTGKTLDYHYLYATIFFIPVVTIFVYLYLGLRDKIFHFLKNKIEKKIFPYKNIIFPIITGGIIGTVLLISPYGAFSGHDVVKILINDSFHVPLLTILIIILLRIIATTISLYANAVGGIFITLMSIGSLIGYGFGEVINSFFVWNMESFYFAAIGAATFMGVIMRLPLTAIVLSLEITYDYNVIVPTGLTVVLVTYLASLRFSLKKLAIFGFAKNR